METPRPTLLGRLSMGLLVVVFGVPVAYFLIIGTWGIILAPFVVALYAVPLFLLHYCRLGTLVVETITE